MNQSNQLVSKAIELQQNALENSQRAMERAMEIPVEGTVDFQRNAAQLMLDGLEMGNWVSNQSVELTRNALDTYLATVENAARDTTQMAEQGMEQAGDIGQQRLAATQQFATGATGNGSQPEETAYLPGPPQQPRQPPQERTQTDAPPQQGYMPQPTAAPQQQPPATTQQRPPATTHQQPPTAGQPQPPASQQQRPAPQQQAPPAAQQPPESAQRPPAGGSPPGQSVQRPADQQAQAPPARPPPQFQSHVTMQPPATLQTQPPQPPRAAPETQQGTATGVEPPSGDQQPRQEPADENESNAVETPAENA